MKVLIVEDQKRIAHHMKKGLEMNHHVVDLAYDGEEGYDLATSEGYDIIVLDRMLPGKEGLDVCKMLRKKNIPSKILMLTAKTEIEDRVQGLEGGADDYLGKPFAFAELLARIHALGRRPTQHKEERLTVQDLQINTQTYEVSRGDITLSLTGKEYTLLEFLVRHTGKVFTKDQLAQQVWDFDADILPNTVQVYMGYLRTKVDKAFPQRRSLVHTVRGFGYKVE